MKFTDRKYNYKECEERKEIGQVDSQCKKFDRENNTRLGSIIGIDKTG